MLFLSELFFNELVLLASFASCLSMFVPRAGISSSLASKSFRMKNSFTESLRSAGRCVLHAMSFRMLADVCFIACLPLATGYFIAVGSLETLRLTLGCCRWLFGLKVSSVSVVAVKRNIVISDIQC